MPTAEREESRRRATRKTLGLSVFLVLGGSVALVVHPVAARGHEFVPWWALALGFAFAELLQFHFEIGREAHAFTFSEVPFVIGLMFANPVGLIVGRLVGEAGYLIGRERQAPSKVAFNLCMFFAECAVALVTLDLLVSHIDPNSPPVWAAVFAAIVAADLVSIAAVMCAIFWHGSTPRPREVLVAGGFTAVTNTALALIAELVLEHNLWSLILLAVVVANLTVAYRSYASLGQRYESLQLFQDFTRAVGGGTPAQVVIETVLQQARQLLRAEVAELVIFKAQNAATGTVVCTLRDTAPFDVGPHDDDDSAQWWTSMATRTEPVAFIARGARGAADRALLDALDVRDCVVAPVHADGVIVGFLAVGDRLGEASSFDVNDARLLETLANHASIALDNGQLIDRLTRAMREREHQALHDSLTGLPNRAYFLDRVEAALSQDQGVSSVAIMLMDLDRFKEVNDTLGHYTGDQLLCEVAQRLRAAVALNGFVARVGGDEFAIVVTTTDSTAKLEQIAERLRAAVAGPIQLGPTVLDIGASIGIACSPEHGDEAMLLIQRADVALYQAKRARSGIEFYDATQDSHSIQQLALTGALRNAIANSDLVVHYQPKALLRDGTIIGAEALVRWQHETFGLVPPSEFIHLAEQSGLITPLTELVLDRALEQCATWHRTGHDLTVAVNISAQNLVDSAFPSRVAEQLARWRIDSHHLILEITESDVLELSRARTIINELRAIGVRFSVDDFGTGYSSLSYLHTLPIQEVKIDRSFITTLVRTDNNAGIVKAIIDLGHNLGLHVVAEGVEDQIVLDRLTILGCDQAQGYYLSRPIPGDDLTNWHNQRRNTHTTATQ
jgi:diguanylate cyclase (GGDEF)-like protein